MNNLNEEKNEKIKCCCGERESKEVEKTLDCCSLDFQDGDDDGLDMCCDIFGYERPSEENAKKTKRRTCC